jgi:hypothetical protein
MEGPHLRPFLISGTNTPATCSWSNLNNSKDCSMFSPTGSGLRRAVFGAVLVLGLPMLAACDNEGPEGAAERAGKAIDNTASSAAKQTGEAMENVGNAIQQKSREASDAMDDRKPAN